jgi:large subunit ribosomal protein L10
LALSKQKKEQVLEQYKDWMGRAQAMILTEYTGVTVKELDAIRARVRDSGGEFHIIKNTFARKVLAAAGLDVPAEYLVKSTAITFAFNDAAATSKALMDATAKSESIKLKGGILDGRVLSAAQVKSLAELPPLPVIRAQLLGTIQAPAGKLVRTINEPARSLASVFRAYADKAQAAA